MTELQGDQLLQIAVIVGYIISFSAGAILGMLR